MQQTIAEAILFYAGFVGVPFFVICFFPQTLFALLSGEDPAAPGYTSRLQRPLTRKWLPVGTRRGKQQELNDLATDMYGRTIQFDEHGWPVGTHTWRA